MNRTATAVLLCFALSCSTVFAESPARDFDESLIAATEDYLANGLPEVDPLIEALSEDSNFHQNLNLALKTIIESPASDTMKINRLRDLQRFVATYAKRHNDRIQSTALRMTILGAVIGASLWMIFGPAPTSFDHFERLVIPFSDSITRAIQGGLFGGFGGLAIGLPLQIRLIMTSLIRDRSVSLVDRTCEALIERRLASRFQN